LYIQVDNGGYGVEAALEQGVIRISGYERGIVTRGWRNGCSAGLYYW
jgi:hypothetical protein